MQAKVLPIKFQNFVDTQLTAKTSKIASLENLCVCSMLSSRVGIDLKNMWHPILILFCYCKEACLHTYVEYAKLIFILF